jgi:hypothetical protein
MLITTSLLGIQFTEGFRFERGQSRRRSRLIALVFCRPELDLMKKEIIPSLSYYHFRAEGNTAFYFGGFEDSDEWIFGLKEKQPVGVDDLEHFESFVGPQGRRWYFIPHHFNGFRKEVERQTKWRYSGGCDMILANSRFEPNRYPAASVDFTSSVVLRLDELEKIPSIPNTRALFEKIFQYAETQDTENPSWGFSESVGLSLAGSAFWSMLLTIVPASMRSVMNAARQFVIQDIRTRVVG